MDLEVKNMNQVIKSWDRLEYDWSPDSKWITYAINDSNFNMGVCLALINMSKPPVNITQHPYHRSYPRWSPDGKSIAFINQGRGRESDISYVWLAEAGKSRSIRDTKRNAAINKMKKYRPKKQEKDTEIPRLK